MKKTIIILGKPGSGKDTQIQLLCDKYGYGVINTGDIVRSLKTKDAKVNMDLAQGKLADNKLVNELVGDKIDNIQARNKFITNGYPRSLEQAIWFDEFLAEAGRMVDLVVYIDIKDETSLKRLSNRKRSDDNTDTVKNRLNVFKQETEEVLDYYQKAAKLVRVDGEGSIENIHIRIEELLVED